jgi:hypothetical protein
MPTPGHPDPFCLSKSTSFKTQRLSECPFYRKIDSGTMRHAKDRKPKQRDGNQKEKRKRETNTTRKCQKKKIHERKMLILVNMPILSYTFRIE